MIAWVSWRFHCTPPLQSMSLSPKTGHFSISMDREARADASDAERMIMFSDVELPRTNCFGCGRGLMLGGDLTRHQPLPNESESDRCTSRPRKYTNLRCQYAVGHECIHSAKVAGTGLHYWGDDVAEAATGSRLSA